MALVFGGSAVAILVFGLIVTCTPLQSPLTYYCPDDPNVEWCPEGPDVCPGTYQCIGYCLLHFPDGGEIPESGMGSWCDDSRLPDYGEFCAEHSDVPECPTWCDAHPGECSTETDGDGDVDGDGDADSDADGDIDADADADADADEADVEEEPECTAHTECTTAGESQCDPEMGECTSCGDDNHCTHIDGLPACDDSTCVTCTAENATACPLATPLCLVEDDQHSCVACLDESVCTSPEASRCDSDTHACVGCETIEDCARFTDTPFCHDGTCVECTEASHCSLINEGGEVCNHTTNLCVEACQACTNQDGECTNLGEGFYCVVSDSVPGLGLRQCMQIPHPVLGCQQPLVEVSVMSDGGSASGDLVAVCVPPGVTVSCQGLVEFGRGCLTEDCGIDDKDDGVCPDVEGYCTYYCTDLVSSTDCPEGSSCGGTTPSRCVIQ